MQQADQVTMCWCTMTLHLCNKERQWNYPITSAISTREPPAVYQFPHLSTVSQFMWYTRRCTDESFPLSQMLMYVITSAIGVLLTSLSRRSVTWLANITLTPQLTMGIAIFHLLVLSNSMKLHGKGGWNSPKIHWCIGFNPSPLHLLYFNCCCVPCKI